MKRILVTSTWFPSKYFPFNGDFVQRFAISLSKVVNVTVLHVISYESVKKIKINTKQVNENYKEIIVYLPSFKPSFINPILRMFFYLKLSFQQKNIDFIHSNIVYTDSLWLFLSKIIFKKQYYLTEHWTNYDTKSGFKLPLWQKLLAKLIFSQAKCVFPVSESLQNGMNGNGIYAKFKIIPNIVNTDIFKPTTEIKVNKIKVFLHVSSLNQDQKNILGILETFEKLYENKFPFILKIIGDDSDDLVKNFIKKHQLQEVILFIGLISHQEVASYMKTSDCFVLFSNYENQPCVIGEAFSCGLPVIATDVGGISEYFPDNFGFIINKNNEKELFKKCIKVIKHHQFSTKEKMNEYVKNTFSEQIIINQYIEEYLIK